jgi:diaminohydroxyphosphoribosylaminopyrimidine deaminase / 5-amino-6-(5-phosphoribosylamino)uracil reductase
MTPRYDCRVGGVHLSPSGADAMFMRRALQLAESGTPAPNPQVGALIVQAGRVVGSGYHARAGGAHAEVIALQAAGASARNGTLYVTLEPCNHQGRTPPCVDALLEAGIARVVIGCLDPNPFVAGGGAARLAQAGISVELGPWPAEARRLISDWVAGSGRL